MTARTILLDPGPVTLSDRVPPSTHRRGRMPSRAPVRPPDSRNPRPPARRLSAVASGVRGRAAVGLRHDGGRIDAFQPAAGSGKTLVIVNGHYDPADPGHLAGAQQTACRCRTRLAGSAGPRAGSSTRWRPIATFATSWPCTTRRPAGSFDGLDAVARLCRNSMRPATRRGRQLWR